MLLLEREVDHLPGGEDELAPQSGSAPGLFAAAQPCPNPKPANEVQIDKVPPTGRTGRAKATTVEAEHPGLRFPCACDLLALS